MANVEPAVLDRMADVYQQSLARTQIAAEAAALSAWFSLAPDLSDKAAMAAWAALFFEVTNPAAEAVSSTTHAYMSAMNAYVGISMALPLPDTDWFRDDFEGWVLSPFTFARAVDGDTSMADSGAHITKLVSSVTRNAEQQAFDQIVATVEWDTTVEFVNSRPDGIRVANSVDELNLMGREAINEGYEVTQRYKSAKRWKRVPQGGACGFCQVLAQNTYSDKAKNDRPTGSYHTFCRCSWRMMTPDEARRHTYDPDKPEWRDIIDERADVPQTTQGANT